MEASKKIIYAWWQFHTFSLDNHCFPGRDNSISVLRFWKESLVTVNLINSKPERYVLFANHNSESVQKFNVRF